MSSKLRVLCAAVLAIALGGVVYAETVVHKLSGLQLWIPDEWDAELGEDELEMSAPDDEVVITCEMLESEDVDAALKELDKALDEEFDAVKVTDAGVHETIHGLAAISVDATATLKGEKVELGVLLVDTPNGHIMLLVAFADPAHLKEHEATIEKILHSIEPMQKD